MPADPCYNRPSLLVPLTVPEGGHRWRCAICGYVGTMEQVDSSAFFRAPAHYAPGDEPGEMEVN